MAEPVLLDVVAWLHVALVVLYIVARCVHALVDPLPVQGLEELRVLDR